MPENTLHRFLDAQNAAYPIALAEMKNGEKFFGERTGRKNTADAGRKRLKSGERNKNNEKRGTSDSRIGALGYGICISLSGYGDLLQSYKKLDNNQFRKSEV